MRPSAGTGALWGGGAAPQQHLVRWGKEARNNRLKVDARLWVLAAGIHNQKGQNMHKKIVGLMVLAVWCSAAMAQNRVYRCGNDYINNEAEAKRRGCVVMEGGNVTVIQSQSPRSAPLPSSSGSSRATSSGAASSSSSSSSAAAPGSSVSTATQSSRDSDARAILEAELNGAQERLANLEAEYNGGFPVRTALELRNPQGYLERTAALKADIERTNSDIESLRREISRLR